MKESLAHRRRSSSAADCRRKAARFCVARKGSLSPFVFKNVNQRFFNRKSRFFNRKSTILLHQLISIQLAPLHCTVRFQPHHQVSHRASLRSASPRRSSRAAPSRERPSPTIHHFEHKVHRFEHKSMAFQCKIRRFSLRIPSYLRNPPACLRRVRDRVVWVVPAPGNMYT